MAEGLNRVTLIGNLGQDPELRHTQGGGAVLTLRIATTESFSNRAGERQERTDWHTVKLWGKRAEALAQYLTKGTPVAVTLEDVAIQTFEKQDGSTASKLVGKITAIDLAGSPKDAAAAPPPPPPPPKPKPPAADTGFDDMDSDIPF